MPKRAQCPREEKSIILAVLVVAVLGGLCWLVLRPREPVYQGRRLSYWLEDLVVSSQSGTTNYAVAEEQARAAIRNAGTNAIPTLLQMLRAHDSTTKRKLKQFLADQQFVAINPIFDEERHVAAEHGFSLLGADASNAVPAIVEIYHKEISLSSQMATVTSLGLIGPAAIEAVPMLVRETMNTNLALRVLVLGALGAIHSDPGLAVPALTKCLKDPDYDTRSGAAWALAYYGKDAKAAVPALSELIEDTSPSLRRRARHAISVIDPEAAAKLPADTDVVK